MDDRFRLARPLMLVTEPSGSVARLLATVRAGLRGGVSHVVLRRPGLAAGNLARLAEDVLAAIREVGRGELIVHGQADVAVKVDARGVHLPEHGLPPETARRIVGEGRLLGMSVHDPVTAVNAERGHVNYLFFGHVYASDSHPGQPGRGLDALGAVIGRTRIPTVAIGGITAERVSEVLAAGASGVAVIRAISGVPDPERAARELRRALDAEDYRHLNPWKERS